MIGTISMTLIWLIIFAVLIIIELVTMGLTTIWFAGGAVIACVLAALTAPIWLQVLLFLISAWGVDVASGVFSPPVYVRPFSAQYRSA